MPATDTELDTDVEIDTDSDLDTDLVTDTDFYTDTDLDTDLVTDLDTDLDTGDLRKEPARWRSLLWALHLRLVLYECLPHIPLSDHQS